MKLGKKRAFALLGLVALICPGCSTLNGRWVGTELTPAMARDQFDLFRPAGLEANFVSADIRLQKDATFLADVKYGGELVQVAGTWVLKGQKLTLTDQNGRAQVFLAKKINDRTVQLITGMKGTDVILEVKKQA